MAERDIPAPRGIDPRSVDWCTVSKRYRAESVRLRRRVDELEEALRLIASGEGQNTKGYAIHVARKALEGGGDEART